MKYVILSQGVVKQVPLYFRHLHYNRTGFEMTARSCRTRLEVKLNCWIMRVLQIDDDKDDLEIFGEAIQLFDTTVKHHGVVTLEAALALFAGDEATVPDIIFLDINMPRHSGFDCYAIFNKDPRFNHTRFVFLSTTIHQKELPKGTAFMQKQHSLKAYVNMLTNLLRPPSESTWFTSSHHIMDICGQSQHHLQCV